MGATLSGPYQTSWTAKKNTKWNESLIHDVLGVGVRYNTSSIGKDIRNRTISGSHGQT